MKPFDIITLIFALGIAVLGFIRGFGKSLRFVYKGVVGLIFSGIIIFFLGGLLRNWWAAEWLIDYVQRRAGALWSFFAKIYIGYVAYYSALFIIIRLASFFIVRLLRKLFESENKFMKFLNALMGSALALAFLLFSFLLVFAVVDRFAQHTEFYAKMMKFINGSLIYRIYFNNPIRLK